MTDPPSYRALMRVYGFPPLLVGILLARTALTMLQVALVLFVLGEYHSPTLAGLASFFWVFPSLVVAPIAGALLDRHGRIRLITLDYAVQVVAFLVIGGLALAGLLPPPLLLAIVGVASLTGVLSIAGGRALFPVIVPQSLWERANALDSQGYVVSTLLGPPVAGLLVGAFGGAWALIISAGVVATAIVATRQVPEPPATPASGGILTNALAGVRYVAHSASLRGLALTVSTYNIGYGIFMIALPVLILDRLHGPPVAVGISYALSGLVGIGAGLLVGRMRTDGRERQLMVVAMAITVVAVILLPGASSLALVFLASAVLGLSGGPFDIALFTLRQRRTEPAWYGRAFAVSMSFNYVGMPIGSAVAGPLIAWSLSGSLWLIVAFTAAATFMPLILVPAREPAPV